MAKDKFDVKATIHFQHHSSIFAEAELWCQKNCEGKYYFGLPNPFYWDFELEEDAMKFKLIYG